MITTRPATSSPTSLAVISALAMLATAGCEETRAPALGAPEAQEEPQDEAQGAVAPDEHAHHAGEAAEAAPPSMPALPADARVFFVSPTDGDEVAGPLEDGKVIVAVQMGAENVRIGPAGAVEEGVGHHHLIIDAEATPEGASVPADETHIHFGGGQTETAVTLSPGPHTLVLQLADGLHRSYGPALSTSIDVTVAAAGE